MSKDNAQLQKLTDAVEKLLNKEVAPVLPVAPVAPVLPIVPQNGEDHNLLMRVDVKVDQLIDTVNKLNDNTGKRLEEHENRLRCLETDRITKKDHESLTNQVDEMKGNQNIWRGGLLLATFIVPIVIELLIKFK